jgi:hypothetical protein
MVEGLLPVQYHRWMRDDTVKIKLMRMSKGNYQWELGCEAESVDEALAKLNEADQKLREQYLEQAEPSERR